MTNKQKTLNQEEPTEKEIAQTKKLAKDKFGIDVPKRDVYKLVETIKIKTSLGEKLQIFERFIATGLDNGEAKSGLQNFIKHILQEGSRQEKKELISCLNGNLHLSDRKITIS